MWEDCLPSCDSVDPDTLPEVKASEIQKFISFKSPLDTSYIVSDVPAVVDYRVHFSVDISREMRDVDKSKFSEVVRSVWNASSCKYFILSSLVDSSGMVHIFSNRIIHIYVKKLNSYMCSLQTIVCFIKMKACCWNNTWIIRWLGFPSSMRWDLTFMTLTYKSDLNMRQTFDPT
jgi:hypothetical protein